ncbi:MAG: aldehyde dehydrogenase family protein [Lentisphaerae bacterium]|nr:aldehyde dehydrogenase family protein [Lentisphaerota bacterium]
MDSSIKIKSRIERSYGIAKARRDIPAVKERRNALKKLFAALKKYEIQILSVLSEELGRSAFDAYTFELLPLARCFKYLIKKLPSLAAERKAKGKWFTFPARYFVAQEPYGEVFINASWNYPFLLAFEPLAGALAAGNRAVLKLSMRIPRSTSLIKRIIEEVFTDDEVICVTDELTGEEIISCGCDYIFFTGSRSEAEPICRTAAEKVIPVTLELGGKNPCIIGSGANFDVAARRIVWGKFTNAGQTCIAPDYILVEKGVRDAFVHALVAQIRRKYSDAPLSFSGCGKVVDTTAYERLNVMSKSGRLLCGGEKNPGALCISPTVVDQLDDDDPLLTQEVFGPLLGVIEYENPEDLIGILSRNPDPLAVYCFGAGKECTGAVRRRVRSGAFCENDCLLQFSNENVPFGGIGTSGMGAYHGKATFSTFSFSRIIMRQSRWFDLNFRYSTGKWKEKFAGWLFRR